MTNAVRIREENRDRLMRLRSVPATEDCQCAPSELHQEACKRLGCLQAQAERRGWSA